MTASPKLLCSYVAAASLLSLANHVCYCVPCCARDVIDASFVTSPLLLILVQVKHWGRDYTGESGLLSSRNPLLSSQLLVVQRRQGTEVQASPSSRFLPAQTLRNKTRDWIVFAHVGQRISHHNSEATFLSVNGMSMKLTRYSFAPLESKIVFHGSFLVRMRSK